MAFLSPAVPFDAGASDAMFKNVMKVEEMSRGKKKVNGRKTLTQNQSADILLCNCLIAQHKIIQNFFYFSKSHREFRYSAPHFQPHHTCGARLVG